MKTVISAIVLLFACTTNISFAEDATKGEALFTSNCAGCHAGGKNFMSPHKSLSKEDLEKNQVNTTAAIINQITNGKSPMPGFGKLGILSTTDIENVTAYVLQKSTAGW